MYLVASLRRGCPRRTNELKKLFTKYFRCATVCEHSSHPHARELRKTNRSAVVTNAMTHAASAQVLGYRLTVSPYQRSRAGPIGHRCAASQNTWTECIRCLHSRAASPRTPHCSSGTRNAVTCGALTVEAPVGRIEPTSAGRGIAGASAPAAEQLGRSRAASRRGRHAFGPNRLALAGPPRPQPPQPHIFSNSDGLLGGFLSATARNLICCGLSVCHSPRAAPSTHGRIHCRMGRFRRCSAAAPRSERMGPLVPRTHSGLRHRCGDGIVTRGGVTSHATPVSRARHGIGRVRWLGVRLLDEVPDGGGGDTVGRSGEHIRCQFVL